MAESTSSDPIVSADGPSGPRASFGLRLVAAIIDSILVGIVGLVGTVVFNQALGNLINLALGFAYYTYLEGSPSGQTVGKRAMNIRVVDLESGGSIGTSRALIRYVGRFLSAIACGVGFLWMLWDKEKQTWHDKLANSVVVPTSSSPVDAWPG